MPDTAENALGAFLRSRRIRLDPAALGFPAARRRTPGLRREEVAGRAGISATWYTWLEQGRGGAPSAEALERIAAALLLSEVEREHLFLLGLGRPPELRPRCDAEVSPRLQAVLDALHPSPAMIRNALWDVLAWNRAAAAVLTDYGTLPPERRNILRAIFSDARVRAAQEDWQAVARFVVAAFRADAARAGEPARVAALVAELSAQSPAFAALWQERDVGGWGEGTKRLNHAVLGPLQLDYSSFGVDGRTDLSMIVYTPATAADAARIATLIAAAS